MAKPIQLAVGQVTESEHQADRLTVVLLNKPDTGEEALIIWPFRATRVPSGKLAETIARACRILANSSIDLAARHGRKRWL